MLQWPGQLQTATVLFDATLRIPGGLFEGPRGDEGTCTIYLLQSAEILLIVAAVPVFRVVRTQTLPAPSVDNVHFPAGLSGHLPAPVGGEFPPDALKSTSA